jgi:hypothetical protein
MGPTGKQEKGPSVGDSMAGDSVALSYDDEMDYTGDHEDITMLEHEADKMSLDGDESCSSSEAPDDAAVLDEDIGDVTDEEDWANIELLPSDKALHQWQHLGRSKPQHSSSYAYIFK